MDVLGIDLGTRKSGVCWVSGNEIAVLRTINTEDLVESLTEIEEQQETPHVVVVDAPIDPTDGEGFRDIDRFFMKGLFNNNHVGLQPNNPDLLNMNAEVEALRMWCHDRNIQYSNDFPTNDARTLRETMPNPAFGILSCPDALLPVKRRLRFRYGRGCNVAPIIVAFETLVGQPCEFLDVLDNAPVDWNALEQIPENMAQEQSDDLVAALVCVSLAWWHLNTDEVGFVKEDRGHYLLPPCRLVHQRWLAEIRRILARDEFEDVETNFGHLVEEVRDE
jgi:hypothetical protein